MVELVIDGIAQDMSIEAASPVQVRNLRVTQAALQAAVQSGNTVGIDLGVDGRKFFIEYDENWNAIPMPLIFPEVDKVSE